MKVQTKAADKSYVAFIVPDIYPCATGGMEIFYYNLLRELKKRIRIILITCCSSYNEDGVEVLRVKKQFIGIPGSGRFFLPIKVFLTLIRHHKKIKLIHFPYTSNAGKWGYVLSAIKKLYGVNYLLHLHGGGMRKWKYLSGNETLFNNADELLGVSDLIKDEYEKRTKRNVKLIYPLVPFSRCETEKNELKKTRGFSASDKIILFVGSLKDIKSPDTLLRAFMNLGKEYIAKQSLKLIFIGTGDLRKSLESDTAKFGLVKSILFTGLIPYHDVPSYFKMADIYVMPSKFEGTPKSLLEAMFNKLPIIASDVTGINNVLTDNKHALLFPFGNSELLTEKLKELISNEGLAKKLAESGYEHYCKKYSFDNTLTDLLEIYNRY